MACTNCSTKSSTGIPKGCGSKGSCGTDSCNKLTVFDWLSNMQYPAGFEAFDIVEVRFKNGRKDFYKNVDRLPLVIGDVVATESSPGHDVGIVSLTGELVRVQMKKKNVDPNGETLKIYRKASQKDIDIWQEARNKEEAVRVRAREIAIDLKLEMKISDVEYQGDGSKATFYYTASDRVDFRQLIKEYAKEFNIRIEMKQVGFRQEASRLGGIGSCGRELCCSTWLTDFRSVNTSAARYQHLSLNPQKLAGQCGKLKCCLNYELDTYLDALKDLPDIDTKLSTKKGIAYCQKIDIFKRVLWFAYPDNSANWYKISVEMVKEILELNARGEKVENIEEYVFETEAEDTKVQNVIDEDSLARFDQPKRKKRPTRKKKSTPTADQTEKKTTQPAVENRVNREVKSRNPRNNNKPQNKAATIAKDAQSLVNTKAVVSTPKGSEERKGNEEKKGVDKKRSIHKKNRNFRPKGSNKPNNNDGEK